MSGQSPQPPMPAGLSAARFDARVDLERALREYAPGPGHRPNGALMDALERYIQAEVRIAIWRHEAAREP